MAYAIIDPPADRSLVGISQKVRFEATGSPTPARWRFKVNAGAFSVFDGTGLVAVLGAPSTVANQDAGTSKGCDKITVRIDNPLNPLIFAERTLVLVSGIPAIDCAAPMGSATETVREPSTVPTSVSHTAGLVDRGVPTQAVLDTHGIRETVDEAATSELTETTGMAGCGCSSPCAEPSQDSTNAGLVKMESMFCVVDPMAMFSRISQTLPGRLQVRTGCGIYRGKGQTLDLGTFFASPADGLASAERIAGTKRMFGWWARLILDTSGNAAIYWGDRTVEGWTSIDGGLTFQRPSGIFGTLTWDAIQLTYTRGLRDGTIYVFDRSGRLLSIEPRERSLALTMTYNGLNQITDIQGGGLGGFTPEFMYDPFGRVIQMVLRAANSAYDRYTLYDYDISGRMIKVLGPQWCVTYFDYDVANNLSSEIDPDNYRTYFRYNGEKAIEVNLPEGAAIYFTYDDTVPDARRTQKDGTQKTLPYNWSGMPRTVVHAEGTETFSYDAEARPTMAEAVDGVRSYYTWDALGEALAQRFPDDTVLYFTYGNAANVTSRKDALGRVTYWNYDLAEYPSNWIDALGNTTYYERDGLEFVTSIKDRRGNVTYYTWDSFGNRTSTQWPDGSVRYYDYNPGQELEVITDELGNVSYFDRDQRGRITKWKDFDGKVTQFAYDNRSNLTTRIDRRSNAWYWEYDGLSRNTVLRTALLNTTYFRYSAGNVLTDSKNPRGNVTYFYYSNKRRIARENSLGERTYFMYMSVGLLESVKDARGATQYFTYDNLRRRASSMDGERNVTYIRYDRIGNTIAQTDPRGFTSYFYPDELNRNFASRNPLDQIDYFYFNAEGSVTCQEDALQRRTYFYFDSRDRQFSIEDEQVNRTYFTFDVRSLQSSSKDARGNVTYFYQDRLGEQFAMRDAKGRLSYYDFDAESNLVASKDALSNTTYFAFDADNRRFSVQSPLSEFTYFTFDAAAKQTSQKDARGNLSYLYFDAVNRVFCEEDAKQARTYFTFDTSGNRNSVKDPLARKSTSFFDLAQRRFAVQDASGGLKYYAFDRSSNRDSLKNERGNVSYFYFDELNRRFAMRNPLQALSYFEFDAVGNRVSRKDPVSRLNYFYFDTLNRMIASEDGFQNRTYFDFDAVGNTVLVKDPRRASVSPVEVGIQYFTFDELNRRSSLKDEVGQVWYFDYDAVSNLTFQRSPRGAFTYFEFDADNRKVSQKDPLLRTWYWTYDSVGNVSSLKDGKTQVTYYHYDVVNLRDRNDYSDSTQHYFEYDFARQMTAMADPTGRTTEGYDSLGRLTFRGNPGSQNLYYEYDGVGNRTSLKDPDGVTVYYVFDAADRMQEVSSGQYAGWISYYEYNLADEVVHETRANGAVTYHGYDAAGRISLIQHRKSDGTLIERYDYSRDEAGNILQQLRGSDSASVYWNYDQASRITKEAWRTNGGTNLYGFEYFYDEAGNRLYRNDAVKSATTYWEYDLGDQMTFQRSGAPVAVYFTFDNNGNLSVEHDVDPSAGRTYYDYEPRNLLTRIDFPGATPTNYFYYNAAIERVRKDDSTGAKKYTWDGIVQVLEKDHTNSTLQRLVKGYSPVEGIGEYTMQDLANTVIYPHKNQVGTTQRHTDSGQTVVNYYEYDSWGRLLERHQSTTQQYTFAGKELQPDFIAFNSDNRCYHFPVRSYFSQVGRFSQIDPMYFDPHLAVGIPPQLLYRPFEQELSLVYAYALNNPTLYMDTMGLQPGLTPAEEARLRELKAKPKPTGEDQKEIKRLIKKGRRVHKPPHDRPGGKGSKPHPGRPGGATGGVVATRLLLLLGVCLFLCSLKGDNLPPEDPEDDDDSPDDDDSGGTPGGGAGEPGPGTPPTGGDGGAECEMCCYEYSCTCNGNYKFKRFIKAPCGKPPPSQIVTEDKCKQGLGFYAKGQVANTEGVAFCDSPKPVSNDKCK